jgi:Lamin Tail Domain
VQNSPVPTPLATRTSTATSTPGQTTIATLTATPTPVQKGFALITGSVVITNVVYTGTATFNEGDEYIDLFNQGATLVNLANYKVRVAGQTLYPLPGNLQIAPYTGCRIYTKFLPSGDPPSPFNGCGGNYSFSASAGPTGIWPNVTGTKVELVDATGLVVATFSY